MTIAVRADMEDTYTQTEVGRGSPAFLAQITRHKASSAPRSDATPSSSEDGKIMTPAQMAEITR